MNPVGRMGNHWRITARQSSMPVAVSTAVISFHRCMIAVLPPPRIGGIHDNRQHELSDIVGDRCHDHFGGNRSCRTDPEITRTFGKAYKRSKPALRPPLGASQITSSITSYTYVISILRRGSMARLRHLRFSTTTKSGCFPRPATHTPYPGPLAHPRRPAASPGCWPLLFPSRRRTVTSLKCREEIGTKGLPRLKSGPHPLCTKTAPVRWPAFEPLLRGGWRTGGSKAEIRCRITHFRKKSVRQLWRTRRGCKDDNCQTSGFCAKLSAPDSPEPSYG